MNFYTCYATFYSLQHGQKEISKSMVSSGQKGIYISLSPYIMFSFSIETPLYTKRAREREMSNRFRPNGVGVTLLFIHIHHIILSSLLSAIDLVYYRQNTSEYANHDP